MIERALQSLVTAIQFLTRIPLKGGMNRPNPDLTLLRSSLVYFSLVGGMIGLLTGLAAWLGLHYWPPQVACLLALALEAVITGGFHEDAVADCCDGLGGGWTADDVLRIMRDSRIGSYGALGLMLAVLIRLNCLASLNPAEIIPVAMASAALGRWAILIVMASISPLASHSGLAQTLGERISWTEVAGGFLMAIPGTILFATINPLRCLLALLMIAIAARLWSRYLDRRIGGVTGDCLGFICYLSQLLVLLVAIAGPRYP